MALQRGFCFRSGFTIGRRMLPGLVLVCSFVLALTGPHRCDLPPAYVSVVGFNKSCRAKRRTKASHLTFHPVCQDFNLALVKCKSNPAPDRKDLWHTWTPRILKNYQEHSTLDHCMEKYKCFMMRLLFQQQYTKYKDIK